MELSKLPTGLGDVFVGAALVSVAVFGFWRWKNTQQGRRVLGRATLRIPAMIGDVIQKVALARFARTLGT